MKKLFSVRLRFLGASCMVLALSLLASTSALAKDYDKAKLILKDGQTVEGKYLRRDTESIAIQADGQERVYSFSEIGTAMGKKSKAGKYGLIFGGGCAGLCLIAIMGNSDDEVETSDLLLGSTIWVTVFWGVGYLIGRGAEDWDTIYVSQGSSLLSTPLDLHLGCTADGGYRVGLSYRF